MLRPSTRRGTDYVARDHAGVGDADDSESRGLEHRALENNQVSNGEPRSRSSSRESGKSGSRGSPRGSPTPGGGFTREDDEKREDMFVVDMQSARELASGAERPRAHVRGWSPEGDSRDRHNRRGDTDSRYDRYRESLRAAQKYSTYQSRSPEFGRYEDFPCAEDFRDRERVRDSRDNYQYQVRAVSGGWETAMAELTKQVGGLVQEVRGIKTCLDSIDSRLSKVEAWEGRLGAVEQQLRERARSPSPGSKCFSCGGEGHYRSECPRSPTVTFEDQIRCWGCGERGHSSASCPRSRSRSAGPNGQGN